MPQSRDPRFDPLPDDPIAQITRFARDLAWGALNNVWYIKFSFTSIKVSGEILYLLETGNDKEKQNLIHYQELIWAYRPPHTAKLIAMGYLDSTYTLTEKAFRLTEQVPTSPVFISYRREESSALALLVVSRMQAAGLSPFLDMKPYSPDEGHANRLQPGDDWEPRLKAEIEKRDDFIVLIAPNTLLSPHVRKEIKWAKDANKRIIPIWHNKFNLDMLKELELSSEEIEFLDPIIRINAIPVEGENPKQYNAAMVELLNTFGIVSL